MIHKLALRNLLRNKRRSSLTSVIIVFAFSMMILFMGLSDGGHKAMIDIGVRMGLGHIIVQHDSYSDDPALQHLIAEPEQLVAQIKQQHPTLTAVTRLRVDALIQAGRHGVALTISGVQPNKESQVSAIADQKAIIAGKTLAQFTNDQHMQRLSGIVIGETLAKNLEVRIGDTVTITAKPASGADLARSAFMVAGIFKTGLHELDTFWAEVPLISLQTLLEVPNYASQIALYSQANPETLAVITQQLKTAFNSYDVQPWQTAAPELYSAVTLDAAGMYLLMLIVYIVVAVGILNTVLMSTFRRQKEFAMMIALGSRASTVSKVVLLEAVYLSAFSLSIGLALGLWGHYHFATEGLNFKEVFGTAMEAGGVLLPEKFYSIVDTSKLTLSVLFVFLLTIIVTLIPAIRAGHRSPLAATQDA
ncbi:ABC transporter permease [Pseudoalteromonas aurantia]|uniref:ABC transporter permease n=2 Tax=Pseudoalteromonas TaxID=53246 RepID=A0A5S3V772_9GAMM|nr:FtsX-like permease family protein [Pseudoalteromonas aurantia]TMO62263.1 ABC transporter permease [Pseudoalteromonas aurantia]TMO67556.1 ABC transporter permease [Pseudoalteromonas aurantia]TMO73329.1 ABC transporter permease [Pseudoalteromonas aurantia]